MKMPQKLIIKKSELCALCLFIIIILETAFGNTPLQTYNLMVNRIIFFVEILIFILFLTMEKYSRKTIAALSGISLFFLCSYFVLNTSILFKMFMMAMVVSKIGITRAFEILFKFRMVILLLIIIMALVGIIPNEYKQVIKGIGFTYGYGLGYTHPNRLASSICCVFLCYIGWKKDTLRLHNILAIGMITAIGYYITKCRTLLYCMFIFIIFYILFKTNLTKKFANKLSLILGMCSIPLCIAISIAFPLLLLSSSGTIQKIVYSINLLFSRRFTNIEHMFLTYPVTLTGGVFDAKMMEEIFGYSVVDNGYVRFLYQYGIIGLVIFGVVSVASFYKMKKRKEYIWVIIFIIVAIEGLLENIYVDIGLDLLVIFWAELFHAQRKENNS